jgi:hypothetical protein
MKSEGEPQHVKRRALLITSVALLVLLVFLAVFREWSGALPENWKEAESVSLNNIVRGGVWKGCVLAAVIVATLMLTASRWGRSWKVEAPPQPSHSTKLFLFLLLAIMSAGMLLRAPRLGLSIYNDEAYSLRRHISGMVPIKHAADLSKFREPKWIETVYDNRVANNSMLFSVLARASHLSWQSISKAKPGTINETALRLPVFICGVLSIGVLGWLGLRLGGPTLGGILAGLAALHPWHIRYSTEGRCYGILFLLLPLLFLALQAAWRCGRWRFWLLFGLLQYLCMLCFMGVAHFLIALNAAIALHAAWSVVKKKPDPLRAIVPALVVGLGAAAMYLAAHFPLVMQASKVVEADFYPKGNLDASWFSEVGSYLGFGVSSEAVEGSGTLASGLWGRWWRISAVIMGLTVLGGLWVMVRRGGVLALLAAATVGGALIVILFSVMQGVYLMTWYSVFLLPSLLLAVGAMLGRLVEKWRRSGAVVSLLVFTAACWPWFPAVRLYLQHGRENLRGVAEFVHNQKYPWPLGSTSGSLFLCVWSEVSLYDPGVSTAFSDDTLSGLIAKARQSGLQLFVDLSAADRARTTHPLTVKLLESEEFQKVAEFQSTDSRAFAHVVYRLAQEGNPVDQ